MKIRFELVANWRRVLRKAWSLWLIGIAAALTGIEAGLPYITEWIYVPPRIFGIAAVIVSALAFPARIIAQKELHDGEE